MRVPAARTALTLLCLAAGGACSSGPPPTESAAASGWSGPTAVNVRVTLDGAPVVATVAQGGNPERWTTDRDGRATVTVDPTVTGDLALLGSHADARIGGVLLGDEPPTETVTVALERFSTADNPDYAFAWPGPEDYDQSTTADCLHCHVTIDEAWKQSAHAEAARDPEVLDLYTGSASATDEAGCAALGGAWGGAPAPGTGETVDRCLVDGGVPEATAGTGACADCHAPGIDGQLGGRDLMEARGVAYESGVHCDVCHKVESVDVDAEAGVAGALHLLRPAEPSPSPALGEWMPLSFGPYDDVVNPVMGSVAREHFHTGEICAGCHEQHQPVLATGSVADLARWPDGRLPVHTTWSEWEDTAYNPSAPCQSCHMPPDVEVGNAADLYNRFDDVDVGVAAGWERPPGEVRQHRWAGPRSEDVDLLAMAAGLDVRSTLADGTLTVDVTVTNVGPGHALPTGEPMRHLLLLVDARCDGAPLDPVGGDVVPGWGGASDHHAAADGADAWPGAAAGDLVRFARRTGAWVDYTGYGPFGDGRFTPEEKGLPELVAAGTSVVVAVDGDTVTLDPPAPAAWDEAWRVPRVGVPDDGAPAQPVAGMAGFGFARVLVDADGAEMVPHYRAVDVTRDNRLLPGASWTSHHVFSAACAAPTVTTVLVHRAWPWALASARGWPLVDSRVEAR